MRQQSSAPIRPVDTVGHVTRRIDAYERVTGKATYTRDVRLPGMLYGRALRSPHPHARIRGIHVTKAAALPGVRADFLGLNSSSSRARTRNTRMFWETRRCWWP